MRQRKVVLVWIYVSVLTLFQWGGALSLRAVLADPLQVQDGWTITEIDTRYIGAFPSITSDSNKKIHVTYYSVDTWENKKPNGALKYATLVNGRWEVAVVDKKPRVDLGRYTDIAIDSKDEIHVGYWDATSGALKYAIKERKADWRIQVIEKTGKESRGLSLTLDSEDRSHLAFHSHGSLRYATKGDKSWRFENLATVGDVLESPGLAIDRSDKVHIVFYDKTTGQVKYATNSSDTWKDTIIDSIGEGTPAPLIVVGPDGVIHVVFYDTKRGLLKYAFLSGDHWQVREIAEVGDVRFDPKLLDYTPLEGSPVKSAMTMDRLGQVHLSFFDGAKHALGYAVLKNGSWDIGLVESVLEKDVGRFSSILVEDGQIHIVYRDSSANVLKYAVHSTH